MKPSHHKWIGDKIAYLITKEGYPPAQAAAIAYSMYKHMHKAALNHIKKK